MNMGHAGPPFEPRRRPQAGKSGDPRSQNADSSPRAQGAHGLGRAERRKGKGEAPRALTACGLGRRVAVDWTWVLLRLRRILKAWHLLGLRSSLSSSAAQIPFLALLLPSSKLPDLLHLLDPGSHGASPSPGRSLVLACFGLAQRVGGIDGAQMFKVGSDAPEGQGSTFYPFFVTSITAGLVPPFSEFFLAVLRHYSLQALHLQPNSVLLLAIFTYYCEAHVGVQPSVALLRHYFYLRTSKGSPSVCTGFVSCGSSMAISNPGKRIEGFRSKWVLVDAGC